VEGDFTRAGTSLGTLGRNMEQASSQTQSLGSRFKEFEASLGNVAGSFAAVTGGATSPVTQFMHLERSETRMEAVV
jgi:phage-related minor tail protein